MPVRVRYQNEEDCTIRPTPLWSVSTNVLKNGAGEAFGVTYTITLNGTIIYNEGTPYAFKPDESRYDFYDDGRLTAPNAVGPYLSFDNNQSHFREAEYNRPPRQKINCDDALGAILSKQQSLRALFAKDGQRLELTDWDDDEPSIICYPRVTSVSFQEGIYVNTAAYTITLEADTLLNKDIEVNEEGTLVAPALPDDWREGLQDKTEKQLLEQLNAAFISDFSESWSIEVDDSMGESPEQPFAYRISRNLSATGKTHYGPKDNDDSEVIKHEAWEQARKFIKYRTEESSQGDEVHVEGYYPNVRELSSVLGYIGSGSLNLAQEYKGYNHIRSENVEQTNGIYSLSDTWIISRSKVFENFTTSVNSSISAPFITVAIEGTIKGLSEIPVSGYPINREGFTPDISPTGIFAEKTPYANATDKYYQLTNSGQFGLSSDLFKRADNLVAVQLNSQPTSVSVGSNKYTGEINYNLEFDNRPTNIISGVISENIQISDTYPGDVFAVIPVIGRPTGPVLQYIGGRTEYTRDFNLDLVLDYTKIPYESGRNPMLLKKPSVVKPTCDQIATLINEVSPQGEPGVRKYFLNPPRESWSPKEGAYSLSMSWVYELDK